MKKIQTVLLAFAVLIVLAGCQATGSGTTAESMTITDARGETQVPVNPQKVAVLDFGHLDTLKQLGLEDRIIGTVTANAPAYIKEFAEKYENVGTLKEPNMEQLAELSPDLIIISNRLLDFAGELEEIAPVLVLNTDYQDYWGSVQKNVRTLAQVFGQEEAAEEALQALEEELTAMHTRNSGSKERAMALMLNNGALSAFSTGSRFSILFDAMGFQPVEAAIEESTHGQNIGYEGILEINPDILFVLDRTQAIQEPAADESDLLDNGFIQGTAAYQKGQIIPLTSDLWYLSGGGLESTRLMIEEIAEKTADL